MRLDEATWLEVDTYLTHSRGILIPVGSTEQLGPMGLIGFDALCAEKNAEATEELLSQGFDTIFFLNGPDANLAPLILLETSHTA